MPAKRIKVVSYWSGIKKANGSGEAEFEFDVPQFSGELRLMAVAYKGSKFRFCRKYNDCCRSDCDQYGIAKIFKSG